MKKNKYSGSNFDDFLKEEGIYEEVTAIAQKELKSLHNNGESESDFASELPNNLRNRFGSFFRRIRHLLNL